MFVPCFVGFIRDVGNINFVLNVPAYNPYNNSLQSDSYYTMYMQARMFDSTIYFWKFIP